MLVSMKTILDVAKKEGYGVAAPNVFNLETIRVAFEAARELKSPIILDCAGAHPIEEIGEIARFYDRKYPEVVAALNLDHGETYEQAIRAIRSGFTSIMVDRSTLSFEDNVAETKEIVKMAHAVGVSVEAELGHVGFGHEYEETRDQGLTNPNQAIQYVKKTNVDCLAVAIGTSHGVYSGKPHLDFELLDELNTILDVPLVLHGGSGTGDQNLQKAIKVGIQKVNLFTDLSNLGLKNLNDYLNIKKQNSNETNHSESLSDHPRSEFSDDNQNTNICDAIESIVEGYKSALKHYMTLFDSKNRLYKELIVYS